MQRAMKLTFAVVLASASNWALAHEATSEAPKVEKRETVVIQHVDADGDIDAGAKHATCDGEPQVDVSDEQKNADGNEIKRSRVVICSAGAVDRTALIKSLQSARESIAGQTELSQAAKDKALAAIDEAIARHSAPK
jgi:hypothetical protein